MDKAPEPVENDTIGSLFAGIERIVRDAESERDRWSHIAATIRVNALHHGATDADVDAMIRGEKNFISFIADIVDARSKPSAPLTPADALVVPEVAALVEAARWIVENDDAGDMFYHAQGKFAKRASAALAPFTDPKP